MENNVKFFARCAGPLFVAMFAMTIGCASNISADTHITCILGKTEIDNKCQDLTKMSQMHGFTRQVFDSLRAFAIATGVSAPDVGTLRFGMPGDDERTPCSGSIGYDACYQGGRFYLGAGMLYPLYESSGVLAPVTVIAHEFGHYLQDKVGLAHDDSSPGDIATVRLENQADCVSGAFISWLSTKQDITQTDLAALMSMIWMHGSNPWMEPYKIHGTPDERTRAFTTGYETGLPGCDTVGNGAITK